jgi:hypothetical protein
MNQTNVGHSIMTVSVKEIDCSSKALSAMSEQHPVMKDDRGHSTKTKSEVASHRDKYEQVSEGRFEPVHFNATI